MSSRLADHSKEAFAFIEEIERVATPRQVIDAMARSLGTFGFEHFVVTQLPGPQERFEQTVISRKWPIGWFELYTREDYVRVDPVIRRCRETVQPFKWFEAHYDPQHEPRAREVMERACDFGMRRGFSLPIHGPEGYGGCFSMSGSHLDLNQRTKPAIHLMAMYAFDRLRQIGRTPRSEQKNPLTQREQEVLRWAAAGRSAANIADLLDITERTVTCHTVNAMRKLGAINKTQAVAYAIQRRLIHI
ncbi:helix-turn-helix transcriptional regulator [Methylobacterium sp. SyP6R]|uniref:helix-turn-helix transcriptional regulator n=1 Tax=Methylobacterium sp. SyP6R TaxID=2718876 RepID=UPI001F1FBC3A|nr:LuxR family transcriptional regulator [Methylobacterium sp. SyP6R]MCF4130076.1 LuxR family transcriptional regulator [Methylobacterium sp. SyP6R]